jgi:hypothetical protein
VRIPAQEPVAVWSLLTQDKTLYHSLSRWAQLANWQLMWEADRDFPIQAQISIEGNFTSGQSVVVVEDVITSGVYPCARRRSAKLSKMAALLRVNMRKPSSHHISSSTSSQIAATKVRLLLRCNLRATHPQRAVDHLLGSTRWQSIWSPDSHRQVERPTGAHGYRHRR